MVRAHEFTSDISDLQASLNGQEYMDQALAKAMVFEWREQGAKVMLLVADAPPHADKMLATWNAALEARLRQIHIAPVAASGVAASAQYLMRSMAALTQCRYVFLTDDSGVGNPHEEPDTEEIVRTVGNHDAGRCH